MSGRNAVAPRRRFGLRLGPRIDRQRFIIWSAKATAPVRATRDNHPMFGIPIAPEDGVNVCDRWACKELP